MPTSDHVARLHDRVHEQIQHPPEGAEIGTETLHLLLETVDLLANLAIEVDVLRDSLTDSDVDVDREINRRQLQRSRTRKWFTD